MTDDEEPDVEVAQKLNLVKLLQASIERIHNCRTKPGLAIELVRLHTLLAPLRQIDSTFEREWSTLMGGQFVRHVTSHPSDPYFHRWPDLLRAQELLMALMERHGMGFQASLPDPVLKEMTEVESQLDAGVAHAQDDPEPVAVAAGDDEEEDEEAATDD